MLGRLYVSVSTGQGRSRCFSASPNYRGRYRNAATGYVVGNVLESCTPSAPSTFPTKAPHPSPLPEGEETDWGMLGIYADLWHRAESDFEFKVNLSGRRVNHKQHGQSSPSGEETDWGMLGIYADVRDRVECKFEFNLICRLPHGPQTTRSVPSPSGRGLG